MYPGSAAAYEGGKLTGMAEMLIPGASLAKGALGAVLAGVIKPRGGNWIPGNVESALGGLRKYSDDNEMEMFRGLASNREKELMELNYERAATLDKLRTEGQPDSVINPIDEEFTRRIDEENQLLSGNLAEMAKLNRNASLNRWIEGPLTKYIKRDMATPEDPIRKLADQGILHMGIPQTIGVPSTRVRDLRVDAGFPQEGLSETPGGSLWENLADSAIHSGPARYLQGEPKDPESTVYGFQSSIERGLGFDHLIDELSNALNPESGLPRNLLLRPEQMQQMGMEKAVRHVDAINKWRAAQQAAANAELANKAMVIREYAENNPKGLRWMELGPEKEVDEALIQVGRDGGAKVELPGEEVRYFNSPEEAKKYIIERRLEKQLKYEGDTMGHCIGGYCPDVMEGNSRIFSLRDAKGEPHVTVEVGPGLKPDFERLVDQAYNSGDYSKFEREFDRVNGLGAYELLDKQMLEEGMGEDLWDFTHYALRRHPETMVRWAQPSIKQVKGKQNLAPKDEYLPFVQDFVRNSPLGTDWGQVDDLINTGLRRVGDKYVTPEELKNMPKTADGFPIGYRPLDDLPEWRDGGLVAQPDYFDDLDAFLRR